MYIGMTGPIASGKGEVIKLLEEKGYKYISLSDIVREECDKRGLERVRLNLQNTGDSLRKEFGAGVLGMKVREKVLAEPDTDWVIDGVRNPAEVEELRKMDGFHLIAVTANRDILMERVLSRAREDDQNTTEEEILARIKRDWGEGEPPEGQQVGKCVEMADFTILNEGTLEELHEQFEEIMVDSS